jgi:hypothetical protein
MTHRALDSAHLLIATISLYHHKVAEGIALTVAAGLRHHHLLLMLMLIVSRRGWSMVIVIMVVIDVV